LYLCIKTNDMTQIEKYIWLIGKLQTFSAGLTLQEISDAWELNMELKMGREPRGNGEKIDRQVLGRWRKAIVAGLGIDIDCRRTGGGKYIYYIKNPEKISGNNVESWVINSLSIFNILSAYKSLDDRIISDAVPRGIEYLQPVLEAMSAGFAVTFTIKNYTGSQFEIVAEPYALRQHNNRWYVLCKVNSFDALQLYELENILKVELLKNKKFKLPRKFNADEYFSRFFGVTINETIKPRLVTVRAWGKDAEQLRALPIHPSQEELPTEGNEYADFRFFVAPTPDFMNYLLGLGSNVEVLEPEQCRFEMEQKVKALGNRYFGWPFEDDSSKVTLNGNFAAFDIKCANSEFTSISSIAVVIVRNGEIVRKFHSYVRPEPFVFDDCGDDSIKEETVSTAPSFSEVWAQIKEDIGELPLVSFIGLDGEILKETFAHYNMGNTEPEHTFVNISDAAQPILGQEVPWMTRSSIAALSGIEVTDKPTETSGAEFVAYLALRYL